MTRNEASSRRRDLALSLSHCLDVCRASELRCALAMDVAAAHCEAPDRQRVHDVLRNCTMLCAATAGAIERLRKPDLDQVAHALVACRAACGAARKECERRSRLAGWAECAATCDECANVCESLLARRLPRALRAPRVPKASRARERAVSDGT